MCSEGGAFSLGERHRLFANHGVFTKWRERSERNWTMADRFFFAILLCK